MTVFEQHESNVRTYCRSFPAVFSRGKNALLYADSGKAYIDFFSAAGSLNYGHNNDFIKDRLIAYLREDGVATCLDMHTTAKRAFLEALAREVLAPRGLDYKVQFCGASGSDATEAALKLARKATGRAGVFSFMGGYHGVTLGSLAVTASRDKRAAAGTALGQATFFPYPSGPKSHASLAPLATIESLETVLEDSHSGLDVPAAIIVETVQAEGGVYVAPAEWLRRLRALCDRHNILLIVDDIQVGCGRTGPFFSFERAGIIPDLVILSKSISGYGAPMSLLLIRPELDVWHPGEHVGTFRGYQLAFVGAVAALEYGKSVNLERQVAAKETLLSDILAHEVSSLDERIEVRGLGLIWGVDVSAMPEAPRFAESAARRCFELGLVIERVGRNDTVLKVMPPLTIEPDILKEGCAILRRAISGLR